MVVVVVVAAIDIVYLVVSTIKGRKKKKKHTRGLRQTHLKPLSLSLGVAGVAVAICVVYLNVNKL